MEQEYFWNLEDMAQKNAIGPDEPVKWFFFNQDTKYGTANIAQGRGRVMEHSHDEHDEFLYIISGEADWTVGGITQRVKPGSFMIIPIGTKHHATVISDSVACLSIYAPFFDKDNPDRHFTAQI